MGLDPVLPGGICVTLDRPVHAPETTAPAVALASAVQGNLAHTYPPPPHFVIGRPWGNVVIALRRAKAALPWIPRAAQPHAGPRAVAPPRRAPFRRAARFALLALTLVLGGVLLWSTPAEAQTARILVSNTAQGNDDQVETSGNEHAQLFGTGGATNGYTLTSVIVVSEDAEGDGFDVEVCEADGTSDDFPTTTCTVLTTPQAFPAGSLEFTHPGILLDANTNYVVVIKQDSGSVTLDSTTAAGEDATGLTGWSIKDKFDLKSSGAWQQKSGGNEAIQITVKGYETPTNQDATGAPRVLRSAESAGILVADTSGIADGNGFPTVPGPLIRVDWSYQWIRIDGDTSTETNIGVDSPSYQPVDADIGNLIKVQVSFEDGGGNSETVTSLPFGPLAQPAGPSQTPSTLVGNTGQSPSATAMITGQYAMGFRLGTHGQGYEISSVSIDLAAAPSSLTVSLWIAGHPELTHGETRAYKLFDFENPSSFQAGLNKFTAPAGAFAYQNVNHFIVLSGFGSSLSIKETTSDNEDAGGETGAILFNSAGGDSSVLRLLLEGSRRDSGILAATYAQSFDNDQEIISLGDLWTVGITVGAADRYLIRGFSWLSDNATSEYGGMGNPMDLWNESSGALGTKRFTLHKIRNNAGLNGWTAPQGATVEGSASYFFGQDARGSFTRVDSILTRTWGIDPAGNDAPTAPGVTLFDGPGDASIGPHDIPFMAVLGEPLHAMVQNLGQADNSFLTVGTANSVVTQGFTTSPNAAGYELQGIGVNIEGSDSVGGVAQVPDDATSVSVAVYSADADGKPAAKLFDFLSPTEYAPGHSFFEAPAGTTLAANTSYVVVWSHLGGAAHRLQQTSSNGEDAGAFAGFSIADVFYRGANLANLAVDSGGNSLEIAVYGNAITPLKRVTGFDFHNSNSAAKGIWGNDDTFWVANDGTGSVAADKLYAYNRSDGLRDTGSDFDNLNTAGNNDARGICSDGTTMFVADSGDNKVYAYKMSDTTRDSSKDVALDADNGSAHGLSCDSAHLWVADDTNDHLTSKIFVYLRSDGSHASTLDIGAGTLSPSNTDGTINNHRPSGMWSNSTTLFVADHVDDKIYAYQLADRTRDDAKNLSLDTDNTDAEGLWFDGRVLWVVDTSDLQLYAYDLPGAQPDNTPAIGVPTLGATAQQDIELTADISGITDSTDGLDNVLYLYQWIRVDGADETELAGETGSSYTPTADDVGKNLKVRVIFDDDAGNQEYPRYSSEVGPVQGPPPTVSSVEFTSNPTGNVYAIDDIVETTVNFSAAVDITGTPQLELDFAGTPKAVDCVAATNQNWMGCYYEVVAGDVAAGGIAIAANKLTLNGGAITATGSTTITAVLAHAAVAIDANHKVDGIRPTLVTTGANAPTTSTDGTKVILTFSEDIDTVTRSLITIEGNSVALPTSGESISGPTVELTLTTALTDSAASLTVALAVGAVSDAAGNDNATLAAATVTNAVVSATAPTVTGVALTSTTAPYGIGEAVQATVTFSESVDITGTPQLELDLGGSPNVTKTADCASATGTTTMVCSYEVESGVQATGGVAIGANKLTLNSGTIYANGSTTNAAVLDHSTVGRDSSHKVDGVRPTLVTTGANAPKTSTDGAKVILTFSEDIGSVDRTNITIYDANAPSNMFSTSGESFSGRTVELTLTTALTDSTTSLEIDVAAEAVTDAAGNSNTTLVAVTVTNNVGSTVVTPTVTGVALTSAPNNATYGYNIGGVIEATVTFSEAVDITGSPQLELNFAGSAKAAGCATGTTTTTMVCSYTVLVNDSAPNGIAIAANKLTGGTITATGSTTAADLDHSAVAINANHKVDGVRPTLVTTGANAPTTSADGTKIIFFFNEAIGTVDRTKITVKSGTTTQATPVGSVLSGPRLEIALATALTSTSANITVALGADAVEDAAGNGNLARSATGVTNVVGVANLDPAFLSTEDGLRSVPEDTPAGDNVGAPVSAVDPDQGDMLTYSLTGTDAASFEIDSDGQLRVATGVELDYEGKRTYRVTVQVSDGKDESGADDMDAIDDTQNVTITVTNVNEAPVVTGPSTASIEENSSSMVASYRATDPEGDKFTWSARSAFSNDFWISSRGELYFRTPPNFEGQTTYAVTVSAIDDDATKPQPGSLSVTVTVTDEEEEGVVTISPPRGWLDDVTQFIADLSDGDGSISGTTWQWARSPNGRSSWTDITGATSYSYMEADADANQYLRATATYTDRLGSGKTASATLQTPVGDARPAANTKPTFAEATATRTVSAGTAAGRSVGAPVRATDVDTGDVLTYSLGGADANAFDIDAATGQIRTKAVLDSTEKDSYTFTVSVHDGFNALYVASTTSDATIVVTITVTAAPTTRGVVGFVGGGGGGGGGGGPSPSTIDFEWTVKHDIESLDSTHDMPTGSWSDGSILWLLENGDGADDAIYAYDLKSGERIEDREFELDERNRAPRGVWSDGKIKILWVSDSGQNKLFAHDLESGERLAERDIELAARNRQARGIWSDGERMYVLDGGKDSVFVYDLESGELLAECALDAANNDPRGIWSDGVTVWVSDHGAKRLFAYRLPVLSGEPDADEEDEGDKELERVRDEEFPNTILSRASNNSPRGLWSDGDVMYVADASDDKVYSYNMPDAIDARLASLTLSGVDLGEFDPGRPEYEGIVAEGVTETTVLAEAMQRRTDIAINPPDADEEADGHQIALSGVTEITVTVTSADGSRTKTYRVAFAEGEQESTPEPWTHCLRGDIAVGFSLVVFEGGSVEELVSCAESRDVAALYALHGGVYVSYILGAPELVNREFKELFAEGLPPVTPLTVKSGGPPSADPNRGDGALLPGPECLRGDIIEGFSLLIHEGGSVEELEACAESQQVTALYALHGGVWVSYILGAPELVNREFKELFAEGLPPLTPLVARSDGPAEAN